MTSKYPLKIALMMAVVLAPIARGANDDAVLRSARAVRELDAAEANQARRAEFSGVVLGLAEPEGAGLVMKDQTDSIYLLGPVKIVRELKPGDYILVRGRTDAGGQHEVRTDQLHPHEHDQTVTRRRSQVALRYANDE